MSADFKVRANPMKIHSIEDFFMLRGGMRGGVKDVYFVRALGCAANTADVIKNQEAVHNKDYIRLNEIPKSMSADDSAFYVEQYGNFTKTGGLKLKNGSFPARSLDILADVSNEVCRVYKKLRPDATDSVVKNFLITLWHRTDILFGLLKQKGINYDPGRTLKISAQNITSIKDYLFLYALSQMGFDVLILNSSADIEEKLNSAMLSDSFKAGNFGELKLPEFSYEPEKPASPKQREQKLKADNATASGKTASQPQLSPPKQQSKQPEKDEGTVKKSSRRRKKSFEQLSSLASSVVMLTAVNSKGEIISSGSGIIIGSDGLTVTNHHVIEDSDAFAVRTENDDNVYWMTEIIKVNAAWDLALIRINKNLKPLKLCAEPQKLMRGQEVVAIGSPLGFFNSVSDGIISGFRGGEDAKYIQFTAPISPGSSGGALLNMYGEIIGITSGHIGESQNINLAVSCENIKTFAGSFLK